MRYGVITSRVDRDPCADLRGALTPVKTKNQAAITDPIKVGELLRAIDGYQGQPSTAFALRLAAHVFARPGELRAAAWREFELNGDQPVWRIPADCMKMREQHIVPLARQVVAILKHTAADHRRRAPPLSLPEIKEAPDQQQYDQRSAPTSRIQPRLESRLDRTSASAR
jgi:integrase